MAPHLRVQIGWRPDLELVNGGHPREPHPHHEGDPGPADHGAHRAERSEYAAELIEQRFRPRLSGEVMCEREPDA
jgi:hypothetical protein